MSSHSLLPDEEPIVIIDAGNEAHHGGRYRLVKMQSLGKKAEVVD